MSETTTSSNSAVILACLAAVANACRKLYMSSVCSLCVVRDVLVRNGEVSEVGGRVCCSCAARGPSMSCLNCRGEVESR
jgi:hypothetical protein